MGTKTKYRKYNLNELNGEIYKDAVFYKELPIDNKDFDERLIVTYSITYRNYLRKIREKQVIRAKKTLHNGKVHAKKVVLKLTRALEFQCPLKFRCQTRELHELERIVKGNFLEGLGGFFGLTVSCACLSKFVGIRRNFLGC